VHAAGVEQESALPCVDVLAVRVPEHDCVGTLEAPLKKFRQRTVRLKVTKAECPQQGLRFLDPSTPVAVHEDDASPLDHDLPAERKRSHVLIVVTPDGLDRSYTFEREDGLGRADISRMQNQIDPA
jgi:hypothetical protein